MRRCIVVLSGILMFLFSGCKQDSFAQQVSTSPVQAFTLADFYKNNNLLNEKVEAVFNKLRDEQRVGQMIFVAAGRLGKPDSVVANLVSRNQVGGVLLLNGTPESFKNYVATFDSLNRVNAGVPLIYSADAEPSLINRKIKGSVEVVKTNQITDTAMAKAVAHTIDEELLNIGILYNYAPVVDLSPNNQAIGNRSFGSKPEQVVELAKAYIEATQNDGIIATAKHFPGHGLVKGDSHHKLVYIDGEMKEIGVYKPLIDAGVLSIMVGHIAVEKNERYGTKNMPATLSRKIVTDLLKNELGFKGVITTDAMNMGAVASIPNASLLAVKAGNDIILMPLDEREAIKSILKEMEKDPAFKAQVYDSVKKIIRMKIVAGLIK